MIPLAMVTMLEPVGAPFWLVILLWLRRFELTLVKSGIWGVR